MMSETIRGSIISKEYEQVRSALESISISRLSSEQKIQPAADIFITLYDILVIHARKTLSKVLSRQEIAQLMEERPDETETKNSAHAELVERVTRLVQDNTRMRNVLNKIGKTQCSSEYQEEVDRDQLAESHDSLIIMVRELLGLPLKRYRYSRSSSVGWSKSSIAKSERIAGYFEPLVRMDPKTTLLVFDNDIERLVKKSVMSSQFKDQVVSKLMERGFYVEVYEDHISIRLNKRVNKATIKYSDFIRKS